MAGPGLYTIIAAALLLTAQGVVFEAGAVGRNLSCYVCAEVFKERSYSVNTACQNPARNVDLIQCGRSARYCKVERVQLHGVMISVDRSCADKCFYGCKFNGFGLTYERCTSCCRAPGCNTDNGAAAAARAGPSAALSAAVTAAAVYWTVMRS